MYQETKSVEEVMDLAQAMTNLDGDAELLQEIIQIFIVAGTEQLKAIKAGIDAADVNAVAIQAHSMKGGASNFCARKFVASALKLEMRAKKENLEGADELLSNMQEYFEEITEVAKFVNWSEIADNWS